VEKLDLKVWRTPQNQS